MCRWCRKAISNVGLRTCGVGMVCSSQILSVLLHRPVNHVVRDAGDKCLMLKTCVVCSLRQYCGASSN